MTAVAVAVRGTGVEEGQLADHVGRAHQRDQVLPAVGGAPPELHLAAHDDVKTVARLALVEDDLALADVDNVHLLGERFRRVGVDALENPAAGQHLIHSAPFHDSHRKVSLGTPAT